MKQVGIRAFLLLPLLALLLPATGCRHNCDTGTGPDTVAVAKPLVGNWLWVRSFGGIAGVTVTPQTAGYQEEVVYNADGSYKWLRSDTILHAGTYATRREKPPYAGDSLDIVSYGGHSAFDQQFKIERDSLYLSDYMVADGFQSVYVRRMTR